jgi:outer membrane protein
MKLPAKHFVVSALAVVIVCLMLSYSSVASAGEKIGYVDFNRALNEVSDGKRAKQKLKDEYQEKQQKLSRAESEVRRLKDTLDRDRLLISEDALQQREDEYRRKYADLEQQLISARADTERREQQLTQEIMERLRQIVREIGKSEGYGLILEKSQDVVLYAPEGGDLTDRVIATYDRGRGGKK